MEKLIVFLVLFSVAAFAETFVRTPVKMELKTLKNSQESRFVLQKVMDGFDYSFKGGNGISKSGHLKSSDGNFIFYRAIEDDIQFESISDCPTMYSEVIIETKEKTTKHRACLNKADESSKRMKKLINIVNKKIR